MKKLHLFFLPVLFLCPFSLSAQIMIDTAGARALIDSASAQIKARSYDDAILNCMDAIQIYESAGFEKSNNMALAYKHMGQALKQKKDYDLAIKAFNQCVDIREGFDEPKDKLLSQCYYGIAHSHNNKQEYDKSLAPYNKVLQLRKEIYGPHHEAIVSLHRIVGNVYFKNGNGEKAIDHYQDGLDVLEHLADDPNIFETQLLSNIAEVMGARGDIDQAILYGQKAINAGRLYEPTPRSLTYTGVAYLNLAGYLEQEGKHELALKHLETAVELLDEGQGPGNPTTAIVHGDMANVYFNMGDWEKAETYYLKWIDNWKETMPADYFYFAEIYMRLGDFYVKTDQPDKGLEYLEMAKEKLENTFEGNHPELSRIYILLGNAFLAKSDFVKARVHYQYALLASQDQESLVAQCNDPGFLVKSYMGLGSIYSQRYQKDKRITHMPLALENYDRALKALQCYQESYYSTSSKIRLAEQSHQVIEKTLATLYQLHQATQEPAYLQNAFSYAEQSKGFVLFEAIQESKALNFSGIPDTLLNREETLRLQITQLDKKRQELVNKGKTTTDSSVLILSSQMVDLQENYDALKTQFEQDYPTYFNLKYNVQATNSGIVQEKLLSSDQTLVEYFVGDSAIFAFVINKGDFQLFEIKKDFPLEDWVRDFRDGLYKYHAGGRKSDALLEKMVFQYQETGQALYDKLITPIQTHLNSSLIIVPDGILGYIPFEALLAGAPTDPINFGTYPFMAKEYAISYNYSATLLQEMEEKQHFEEPSDTWLGFAPFFETTYENIEEISHLPQPVDVRLESDSVIIALRSNDLKPLPNSGQEMAVGGQLWEGKALIGKQATEDRFNELAAQYRILHLSTHGVADARAGDYSYLAFAEVPDSLENELLYVRDLYNLRLNADLVVLSACETGVGELKKGEGIVSLARAFAFAGAKSIVTSLWKVDDVSTSQLMAFFYENLKAGETKDVALQKAKMKYLEQFSGLAAHPFFWAGFIGIGDMEKL